MSTPVLCLVLFAAWAVLLVSTIGMVRVTRVLRRQQAANSFPSGQQHGGDRYWRLNRAHLNCVENLPIFGALVMAGEASGLRSHSFAIAAVVVIVGRVVQSIVHVASNSNQAVQLRFTAFLAQTSSYLWMIGELLRQRVG